MNADFAAFLARMEELQLRPQARDDSRPLADYPTMPPRTCYVSSRTLAEVYPELGVRYGRLTWWTADGVLCDVDHAWNVTPDGRIIDSTWTAPAGVEHVAYTVNGAGR